MNSAKDSEMGVGDMAEKAVIGTVAGMRGAALSLENMLQERLQALLSVHKCRRERITPPGEDK